MRDFDIIAPLRVKGGISKVRKIQRKYQTPELKHPFSLVQYFIILLPWIITIAKCLIYKKGTPVNQEVPFIS